MSSRTVFTLTAACLILSSAAQAQKRIALTGGMLLDGYEAPPIHHATILIEGNKIIQAGPAAEIKIPPDATITSEAFCSAALNGGTETPSVSISAIVPTAVGTPPTRHTMPLPGKY